MRSQRRIATSSISQVARQFGLRASALRYYEQIGLLRPIPRVAGERRYDQAAIERLAVIAAGRRAGLSIKEIGGLFCGTASAPPSRCAAQSSAPD